ncbi:unnamed protein product [Ambrosiozyma monospora]|uniref:Unnamed protein product n=1 Tax=Ambrosiozyma monospora TaxID=43982 RepID=A0ACB5TPC4_AMBMO|nr:unnamed protein product [Ambrosiozyma monospora]
MKKHLQDAYALRSGKKRTTKKERKVRKQLEKMELGTHVLLEKYPYDIQVKEMRQEFEALWKDSSRKNVRFPPLDPHGITTLRKLAKCYNMNHRKVGKSPKCYTDIIKTAKTNLVKPKYSTIDKIMKGRPIFKRTDIGELDKREKLLLKDKRKKSRGEKASKLNKWNYAEGDVVGANATAIGQNNIGHKLLLKMGWVKGEALGPEGNKGIVEPIEAKVKKTKLGIK